ncbi:MAG TPA: hypothetical protein VFF73_21830 [Planctomycetota bacterium]|nr:hypothetical protein [Planctomycetota bacterium]
MSQTKQAKQDVRNLKSLTRRAVRALERTARSLRRRGRDVLVANRGWDGPDPKANEKLADRVANAAESLDSCLDELSTRALVRQRDPGVKETRWTRYARKCERVAGRALKTLGELHDELEEGNWTDALRLARRGGRDIAQRLDMLALAKPVAKVEAPAPVAQPPVVPPTTSEHAA